MSRFETLISVLKVKDFTFTAKDFLVHDAVDRRQQAEALRMQLICDFGRRDSKSSNTGDKGYKLEHLEFFWPVDHNEVVSRSKICCAGF